MSDVHRPVELYLIDLPWATHLPVKGRSESVAVDAKSVMVLPFNNLSPGGERKYIGEGITEELINGLSRIEGLKVIARTTAFSFKGKDIDIRELEDIFDVQDEIALSIIETLKIKILKTHKPVDVYTENTEAYMLYLQGRHLWNMRSPYGLEKALEYFNRSLASPTFRTMIHATHDRPNQSRYRAILHAVSRQHSCWHLY